MTEQEAEALAARLTRIWEPFTKAPYWGCTDGCFGFRGHFANKGFLSYYCNLERQINIELDVDGPYSELAWDSVDGQIVLLDTSPHGEAVPPEELLRFEAEWFDFFRRGCWLSGCPIEASAHEKAEWALGFSQEELEAWDL